MYKFTSIPKEVWVLKITYTPYAYNGYCNKSLCGKRWIVGKYIQADKNSGFFKKGDCFIIEEDYK